jgi:hypothetical protein
MPTGKKDSSLAGKQLANPVSTKAEKSVAGSALAQAKHEAAAPAKKK